MIFLDWVIYSPFINERTSFTFSSSNDTNKDIITIYQRVPAATQSFKIKAKLRGNVLYRYYVNKGDTISVSYYEVKEGINILPDSADPTSVDGKVGFVLKGLSSVKVEQIPSFEGAFVTDGVNDLIISTKTVQEMLGGSNEITVVSMIHQIGFISSQNYARNNYFIQGNDFLTNTISAIGKIGIYGYKGKLSNIAIVNDILGDKKDYSVDKANPANIDSVFSVNGTHSSEQLSSVAWYWTIIANKVLTTDEINQVIAYFNLDRTLKPDILCNIGKQGITNDNHAEFNDKLIDYSGNGRDIQMNNLAWKGGSGIAAKQYETFKDWTSESSSTSIITQIDEFTRIVESTTNGYWVSRIRRDSDLNKVYDAINVYLYQDNNFLVHECKYEVDGIKYAIPINESVGKGYHKLEMYTKDRYTELPENAENIVLSEWYFPKSTKGSIKYSVIPSYKGGILLDGINDFGKVTGMPVYKDYTVVADYFRTKINISTDNNALILSKSESTTKGAFMFNTISTVGEKVSYSFGTRNVILADDTERGIFYQSKYVNNGETIQSGEFIDSDKLWLGTFRDNDSRFFNGVIYSIMTFPYSMSEFLIERQLKKHKLGTLYPNMVEFRPVIKANANYKIGCYQIDSANTWKSIKVADYIVIGTKLAFQITFDNDASELKEVVSHQLSGIIVEKRPSNFGYNIYSYITSKSPQKINITIDEYIRYEDIVQPYPVVFQITDRNTNQRYSWGDKIKVGSSIQLTQGENPNLLSGLYSVQSYEYEGETYTYNQLKALVIIITKSGIQLSCNKVWTFDDNEPKCILSPRLLRIPNSSYKILGYIPDISGHGNHGVIHNSVYVEGSGVNEDGSYQFDGVDDFVTIPTVTGGKQVLMKVNWNSYIGKGILYDQRGYLNEFAIYNQDVDSSNNHVFAYQARNNGQTYIDGILNNNINVSELRNITHNITITNELSAGVNTSFPVIGSNRVHDNFFTNMALYDFMLFDNISTDDKIKQLNEYVGIEAKVELPPYYWDAYGKTNLDADKATIQQRGTAVGDYDLTNYNHAYDKMSGYGGYKFAKFDNELDWYLTPDNGYIDVVSRNGYSITLRNLSTSNYGWYFQNSTVKEFIAKDIPFKVKANKSIRVYWDMHSYKSNGENFGYVVNNIALNPNEDTSINLRHLTEEELTELDANKDRMYYLLWFDLSTLAVDEEVTIEMLPLYPNGLAYD